MPVSLLLCEGADSSPDVRVLTKLCSARVSRQETRAKQTLARSTKKLRVAKCCQGCFKAEFSSLQPRPGPVKSWC